MIRPPVIFAVASLLCIAAHAAPTTQPATGPATQPRARPDEHSTGFKRGMKLKPSGSIKVNTAGAVVEGLDVYGRIIVEAPNVTIRNCRIVPFSGNVGIKITGLARDTLIEDCEITGPKSSNGISGSNYTARRLHIHHMGADAFRVVRNVTIEGCYVHDIGMHPDAHGDVVQMYPTDGGNMRIIGNHFDARGANAALFQVDNGWHVEGNFFNGGNYTIQCQGVVENVFKDNVFGRDAKYGPVRVGSGDPAALTWQNNRFIDGKPVVVPPRKGAQKRVPRPTSRGTVAP